MAQLVSTKNLLMSSRPLAVGAISDAAALEFFTSLDPTASGRGTGLAGWQ
jgi:hypothetical protein